MTVHLLSQVIDLDVDAETKIKLIHLADNGDENGMIELGFTPIPELSYYDEFRESIFRRDGYRCKHCQTNDDLTIDHIVPRSKGGLDHKSNLQTLCRSCNSRKGAR